MSLACLLFLNNFQCLLSGQKQRLTLPAVSGVTCRRLEARAQGQASDGPAGSGRLAVVSQRAGVQPRWTSGWRSQTCRHLENQVYCGIYTA